MWYDSSMAADPTKMLKTADEAVAHARSVRRYHARRTDRESPQRHTDLDLALDRLSEAMRPLWTAIARFPYEPQTDAVFARQEKIREASEAIQRERRKLHKMLTPAHRAQRQKKRKRKSA